MTDRPVVGVLALQGCVQPHRPHLEAAGAGFRAVRRAADLAAVDALILPGGESTTMLRLIGVLGLEPALRAMLADRPAWGICAGAILMAARMTRPAQPSFGVLDITVERNAYGRQLDSVQAAAAGYPVSFIRAPRIAAVHGAGIEILATRDGDPTWLRAGRHMATTFHPELTLSFPSPMHRAFLDLVERHRAERDAA